MPMYSKTASGHPSTGSSAGLSQLDRDRSGRNSVEQQPQEAQDSSTAFEQLYNSWDLDPYLDYAGTRHSILYSADVEDQAGTTEQPRSTDYS